MMTAPFYFVIFYKDSDKKHVNQMKNSYRFFC